MPCEIPVTSVQGHLAWFQDMVDHCYDYAEAAKAQGRPIVGILCEFTPRELILAVGGIPVCLCGGSAVTIPAAETTCDGKKKMYELLGATKPMHVLHLPHRADDPDAFEYWVGEVARLRLALEDRFGVKITDDRLREAIQLMNRERSLRRQLADLMIREIPPITGRQLLDLKSLISGIEADLRQYEKILEFCQNQPVAAPAPPSGARKARSKRVLLTGVPIVHGAELIVEVIESSGAMVVCMENCTGLKPILEDVDLNEPDPIRAIARKYYHLPCSVMTSNARRMDLLRSLVAKYRPDCIIDLVWQACLTYDVEAYLVRRLAEEKFQLPYLKITTDYSPSDSARIRARVEALFETVDAH